MTLMTLTIVTTCTTIPYSYYPEATLVNIDKAIIKSTDGIGIFCAPIITFLPYVNDCSLVL